jgi:hypothetical protein
MFSKFGTSTSHDNREGHTSVLFFGGANYQLAMTIGAYIMCEIAQAHATGASPQAS